MSNNTPDYENDLIFPKEEQDKFENRIAKYVNILNIPVKINKKYSQRLFIEIVDQKDNKSYIPLKKFLSENEISMVSQFLSNFIDNKV